MTTNAERPMKVMILCGGFGTRLSTVGIDVPKPMVPIGGRPILWHIMKGFAHWGYPNFVLCLGYRGDLVRDYWPGGSFGLIEGEEHRNSRKSSRGVGKPALHVHHYICRRYPAAVERYFAVCSNFGNDEIGNRQPGVQV